MIANIKNDLVASSISIEQNRQIGKQQQATQDQSRTETNKSYQVKLNQPVQQEHVYSRPVNKVEADTQSTQVNKNTEAKQAAQVQTQKSEALKQQNSSVFAANKAVSSYNAVFNIA